MYIIFKLHVIRGGNGHPHWYKGKAWWRERTDVAATAADEYRDMLVKIFGMDYNRIALGRAISVTCNPEQFAKFIVLRNKLKFNNWIEDLDAQIYYDSKAEHEQYKKDWGHIAGHGANPNAHPPFPPYVAWNAIQHTEMVK